MTLSDEWIACIALAPAEERAAILKVLLRSTPVEDGVDLGAVAAQTEGLTGADLSELWREACMAAMEEAGQRPLAQRHFEAALRAVLAA